MVPVKLLGNEEWSLNFAPSLDGSAAEPSWKMALFKLLNDLITMSYRISRWDMEVNEGKNWMKNKMKEGVKMGLLLALKNYSSKLAAGRVNLARFSWVLTEISSGFFGRSKLGKWGLNSCEVCIQRRKKTKVIAWVDIGMAAGKAEDGSLCFGCFPLFASGFSVWNEGEFSSGFVACKLMEGNGLIRCHMITHGKC